MLKVNSYVRVLGRGLDSKEIYVEHNSFIGKITEISESENIAKVEFIEGYDNRVYDHFYLNSLTEYNPDLLLKRKKMLEAITDSKEGQNKYTDEWNNVDAKIMVDECLSIFNKLTKEEIFVIDKYIDEYTSDFFKLLRIALEVDEDEEDDIDIKKIK